MIQVKAIKDGKTVAGIAFKDVDRDTLCKSLLSARIEMIKRGIEFDDLKADFLNLSVDVESLERAYLAPTDPELVKLLEAHEKKASGH